ncbi:MAG: dTDP-4-dehydrorhamnose reductase [Armatimonadota bacterium]|jgi:dTDP-4-dehydrorhamnose reductase
MIAVIGANGQLGVELCRHIPEGRCAALTHEHIEVADDASVRDALSSIDGLEAVINCAAYHNVPQCEQDPAASWAVNGQGAAHVAAVAREREVPVVFVSTDYVFDGAKDAVYVEADTPNPLSVYAKGKLAGELAVLSIAPRGIVVRVCGLFGAAGCRAKDGGNFVKTMLRLGRERETLEVTDDQVVSPTYAPDAARLIVEILQAGARGILHVCNSDCVTWREFAELIFAAAGMGVTVLGRRTPPDEARMRPAFSALRSTRLETLGITPSPDLKDALRRYLAQQQSRTGASTHGLREGAVVGINSK